MVKGLVLVALLACSSVATAAERFELSIAMSEECSVEDDVLDVAAREATSVWSRGSVGVRWVKIADLPYRAHRSQWLVARCLPGELTTTGSEVPHAVPIVAIRFVGSQPLNTIVLSVRNARILLKLDNAESRDLDRRFKYLENVRLGRMLGRAIAHEIGHFLNGSQAHSKSGLMKPSHTVAAFTSRSLAEFGVEGVDVPILNGDAPILNIAGARVSEGSRR